MTIEDKVRANKSRVHALKRSIPFERLILKAELFLDVLRDVFRSYSKFEDILMRNVLMKLQRIRIPGTNVNKLAYTILIVVNQLVDQRRLVLYDDGGWNFDILRLPPCQQVWNEGVYLLGLRIVAFAHCL